MSIRKSIVYARDKMHRFYIFKQITNHNKVFSLKEYNRQLQQQ